MFSALAYGAVQLWVVTIIEIAILSAFSITWFKELNKGRLSIPKNPLHYFILLFILLLFISLFLSADFYQSRLSFYKILSYLLLFYYVILNTKSKEQIKYICWAIVIFGSLYATVALSLIGANFIGIKNFSNEEHITLTFVNRNHFAGFLEMIVWVAVGLALSYQGSKRVLFLFLGAYMASAIFFSLSRGGSIGFLGSAVFLIIVFLIFETKKKYPLIVGGFLLLLLFTLFWLGLEPIITRFETLQDPEAAGISRFQYWATSLKIILDHFWLGTGIGTYSIVYPQYQADHANMFVTHAHNDYLELTVEMGIIGILSFTAMIVAFYFTILKRIKLQLDPFLKIMAIVILASVFSLLIHSFTDFNFHIPSNVLLFVVLIAVAIKASEIGAINEPNNITIFQIQPSKTKWVKVLFVMVSSIIIIGILATYVGDLLYKKAVSYQSEKNDAKAEELLQNAITIDRKNPEYYARLADVLYTKANKEKDRIEKNRLLEEAQLNYQLAIKKSPNKSMYHTKLAFVLQNLDRNEQALDAYRQAIYYMPNKSYTHYNLALFYYSQKKYKEAEDEFKLTLILGSEYLNSIIEYLENLGHDYEYISQVIPAKVPLHIAYANVLTKQRRYEEAAKEWYYINELEPTEINAERSIYALIRKKDYVQAIEDCDQFLVIYPESIRLKERLVYLYQITKNNEKLIASLKTFLDEHPLHISFYLKLASSYMSAGEMKKAKDIYLHQITLNPDNAGLYFALANYYKTEKNNELVLENLKQAINIDPNNTHYRYQLAMEYQNLKLYSAAIEQLEKNLEMKPKDKRSQQGLEKIYKTLNIQAEEKN